MCHWLQESCFRYDMLLAIVSREESGVLLQLKKVLRAERRKECAEVKALLLLAWLELDFHGLCVRVVVND